MRSLIFPSLLLLLLASSPALTAELSPGWHEDQSIVSGGRERFFRFLVPESMEAERPALVIYLHGGGSSMRDALTGGNGSAHWPTVAEQQGFILLAPNGLNGQTGDALGDQQHWNDCRGDPGPGESTADDVTFITDLIDWAAENLGIDTRRVYVNGSSNGGMMSFRLADEAPGRFAAVAAFIANQPANSECMVADRALPMMILVGTEDSLMPFNGGQVADDRGEMLSADETRDLWLRRNRLWMVEPQRIELPDLDPDDGSVVNLEIHADDRTELRYYVVEGGGHAMPSIARRLPAWVEELLIGPQNHDLEGAEEAWEFFSRFQAPAPERAHSLSGLWFDPQRPGDGFNLVADGELGVVVFYGWDPAGQRLWLHSETFTQAVTVGSSLELEMYVAEGGDFGMPADPGTGLERWGTLRWQFRSCQRIDSELVGDDGELKAAPLSKLLGVAGADC